MANSSVNEFAVEEDAARVFAVLWTRRTSWTSAELAARKAGVTQEVARGELTTMVREHAARKQRRGMRLVYKPSREGPSEYRILLIGAAQELGLLPGPRMKPLFLRGSSKPR